MQCKNSNILITGDIHNNFGYLNSLINRKRPEIVICCGDFGYWPNIPDAKSLSDIKTQGALVLWCDGNHEDHWALKQRTTDEIVPGVVYMPRGSTYTLPDGRTILFMGGADSIDKNMRTEGIDWFREEVITQSDFKNLPDEFGTKIDIVVSHTCPDELVEKMLFYNDEKFNDPSTKALSRIWDMFYPSLWYFGHWHTYVDFYIRNTRFFGLDCVQNHGKWWTTLL